MTDNPPRRTAIAWIVVAIVGAIMVFLPGIIGIEGFGGGFAISFVGIFVVLIGIVVTVIYAWLANILDKILRGEGLLAHWTYTQEEWRQYAEKEYAETKTEKRGLFIVVVIFALFFGFFFWALDAESGFYVFLVMLSLIGIIGLTWQLSAFYYYREKKRTRAREVYITTDGVYLNRRLFTWRLWGTSLDSVTIEAKGELQQIVFKYTSFARPGPITYTTRVPVPDGQEEKAQTITQQLNSKN